MPKSEGEKVDTQCCYPSPPAHGVTLTQSHKKDAQGRQ